MNRAQKFTNVPVSYIYFRREHTALFAPLLAEKNVTLHPLLISTIKKL